MADIESSLMKLNKKEMLRNIFDYKSKFHSVLDDLRNDISELKSDFKSKQTEDEK